jgi:hypothetical protein
MDSAQSTITVQLWQADAVVLFDWLMSVDLDAVPITHRAQKQALIDLLSALEWRADLDIRGSTVEEIAAAQAEVARDMGWQECDPATDPRHMSAS